MKSSQKINFSMFIALLSQAEMAREPLPSTICDGSREEWTLTKPSKIIAMTWQPHKKREEPHGDAVFRSFLSSCRDPQAGLFIIIKGQNGAV